MVHLVCGLRIDVEIVIGVDVFYHWDASSFTAYRGFRLNMMYLFEEKNILFFVWNLTTFLCIVCLLYGRKRINGLVNEKVDILSWQ